MKCTVCGNEMQPLLFSTFCPTCEFGNKRPALAQGRDRPFLHFATRAEAQAWFDHIGQVVDLDDLARRGVLEQQVADDGIRLYLEL